MFDGLEEKIVDLQRATIVTAREAVVAVVKEIYKILLEQRLEIRRLKNEVDENGR